MSTNSWVVGLKRRRKPAGTTGRCEESEMNKQEINCELQQISRECEHKGVWQNRWKKDGRIETGGMWGGRRRGQQITVTGHHRHKKNKVLQKIVCLFEDIIFFFCNVSWGFIASLASATHHVPNRWIPVEYELRKARATNGASGTNKRLSASYSEHQQRASLEEDVKRE